MQTAFSIALSGLTANTIAIDVTGNNLANLNTAGYKATTLSFHDLVAQSLGATPGQTQIGVGVGAPITLREFSQGAIQATGGPLDAAIQGDGFFIVTNSQGDTEYTRAGNFEVNSSGSLTTPTGEFLQGWTLTNGVVNTNAPLGNITVPTGTLAPPVPTQNTSVTLNLDASGTAGPPPSTFSTSLQVFDSLGTAHTVTYSFTKNAAANTWDYSVSVPDADLKAAGTPLTGQLVFDSNGNLLTPAATDVSPVLTLTGLADNASDMSINWNLYNNGAPLATQFAEASASSAVTQDGAAAASLSSVGLANGGQILARYSNGQQVVVGQLALATIRNPESLIGTGDNLLQSGANTALPSIGVPGTGGRGVILGGSIEASTADIATEFTNLIIFQRGYEANAHVITTVDQLSQDTINLKQ
jgi:flagellar hook protein FlgE